MKYTARELDQRVTIQRETREDDGQGGAVLSWKDIATVWAHVRPMSGRERERAGAVNAEARYLIVIRYRNDIDESDVVVWNGKRFNIRFAKERARVPFLELEAERGVAS
jgi:SPP1 family predicted phage head-tail adaptor